MWLGIYVTWVSMGLDIYGAGKLGGWLAVRLARYRAGYMIGYVAVALARWLRGLPGSGLIGGTTSSDKIG